MWSCFDGSARLDDLIDDLSVAFGVERDVVSDDVLAFTRRVGRLGLLEASHPTPLSRGGYRKVWA